MLLQMETDRCIACGACVKDCIAANLSLEGGRITQHDRCFGCGHCVAVCPKEVFCLPEFDMADVEVFDEERFGLDADTALRYIKFRRSVRQFQNKPVEQEKLEKIIQAGRYTETAANMLDVEFTVVAQEMDAFKPLVYGGWRIQEEEAQKTGKKLPGQYRRLYTNYVEKGIDRLFFHAPAAIVLAAYDPIDAGLAAANMELLAVAQGLGVLVNGLVTSGIMANPEAQQWLGLGKKTVLCSLLVGYPAVRYLRTAPRPPAKAAWR